MTIRSLGFTVGGGVCVRVRVCVPPGAPAKPWIVMLPLVPSGNLEETIFPGGPASPISITGGRGRRASRGSSGPTGSTGSGRPLLEPWESPVSSTATWTPERSRQTVSDGRAPEVEAVCQGEKDERPGGGGADLGMTRAALPDTDLHPRV